MSSSPSDAKRLLSEQSESSGDFAALASAEPENNKLEKMQIDTGKQHYSTHAFNVHLGL